jgi:hypothetical protein
MQQVARKTKTGLDRAHFFVGTKFETFQRVNIYTVNYCKNLKTINLLVDKQMSRNTSKLESISAILKICNFLSYFSYM